MQHRLVAGKVIALLRGSVVEATTGPVVDEVGDAIAIRLSDMNNSPKKPAKDHPWRKRQDPTRYKCNVCSPTEAVKRPDCFDYHPSGVIRATCRQCRSDQARQRRKVSDTAEIAGWLKKWGKAG